MTMAATSTKQPDLSLDQALGSIPDRLRTRLLTRYYDLKQAFLKGDYDACILRSARFAEVLLRVIQKELTGQHIPLNRRIPNFAQECAAIERLPAGAGPESMRVIIPRALMFIYTVRNKRGVGHEADDVDANEIDAVTCSRVVDWCLADLVRILENLPLEDAQALVDAIAERETPQVWSVAGKRRVLATNLSFRDQTLLLMYSDPNTVVPVEDLFEWVEYSQLGVFRRDVLSRLHRARLVEFDRDTDTVTLSPTGAKWVEDRVLPNLNPRQID
jgi:hypothetical protein